MSDFRNQTKNNLINNITEMDVVEINKYIKSLKRNINTINNKSKERRAKKFNENVLGNSKINNPTIPKLINLLEEKKRDDKKKKKEEKIKIKDEERVKKNVEKNKQKQNTKEFSKIMRRKNTDKKLTTIFISQADPDYYFGAETLQKLFPEAKIIATPSVKKVIEKKVAGKVAYWGPKMGKNAPENVVTPDAYEKLSFSVDGHVIEIKGTTGLLAHRPYLWIPSIGAIVGDIAVFGGVHVWTADVQDKAQWNAWLLQLAEMKKLSPQIVVPGHMKKGTKLDASNLQYTSTYLSTFEQAKKNSADSKGLINKMNASYPDAQFPLSLNIGAKVHKGEMKW